MSKKVSESDLKDLIKEVLSEVDEKYNPLTISLNSIYGKIVFRTNVDRKFFKKLKRKLQQYVGKNLKLSLSEDKRDIIIKIDYEII